MALNIRPGEQVLTLKELSQGRWGPVKSGQDIKGNPLSKNAPATITTFVNVTGNAATFYMLTVGHAYWDVDENRRTPPGQNNDNLVSVAWLPRSVINLDDPPFAQSFGQYFRPGDKLDSRLDGALATMAAGTQWNQQCTIPAVGGQPQTIKLTTMETVWPWQAKDDETYSCQSVQMRSGEFVPHDDVAFTNWITWSKSRVAKGNRILLRLRPASPDNPLEFHSNKTPLIAGASGAPLIRYAANSDHATVVGMFLGITKMSVPTPDGPSQDVYYEIFQHISVAVEQFHLAANLPQPNP